MDWARKDEAFYWFIKDIEEKCTVYSDLQGYKVYKVTNKLTYDAIKTYYLSIAVVSVFSGEYNECEHLYYLHYGRYNEAIFMPLSKRIKNLETELKQLESIINEENT